MGKWLMDFLPETGKPPAATLDTLAIIPKASRMSVRDLPVLPKSQEDDFNPLIALADMREREEERKAIQEE